MIKQELGALPSPSTTCAVTTPSSSSGPDIPSTQAGRATPSTPQSRPTTSASPLTVHNTTSTSRVGGNTVTTTTTKSQTKSVNSSAGSQRQQKVQQIPHSIRQNSIPTSSSTPPTTHFTSAIMRNQRPPNVNVGPDGLNISQPMLMSGNTPPSAIPPGQPWYRPSGPAGPGGPSGPGGQ